MVTSMSLVLTSRSGEWWWGERHTQAELPGWMPRYGLRRWDSSQAWKWCALCHSYTRLLGRMLSHGLTAEEAGECRVTELEEGGKNYVVVIAVKIWQHWALLTSPNPFTLWFDPLPQSGRTLLVIVLCAKRVPIFSFRRSYSVSSSLPHPQTPSLL